MSAGRKTSIEVTRARGAEIVHVSGAIDEHFTTLGHVGLTGTVILNVSGMTRLTSFGVRQWARAIDALPKLDQLYLVGCPSCFVDQLNMVLNFVGTAKVLSVAAPFTCASCEAEVDAPIDMLAERAEILRGELVARACPSCGGDLVLDEPHDSYFAFAEHYGATELTPAAAKALEMAGLYRVTKSLEVAEKPIRVVKLVQGAVSYFRVGGTLGERFRARPFLVGEGEVIIDLTDVDRFDARCVKEWRRLVKTLSSQVTSITVVGISESFLAHAGSTLTLVRNIVAASVVVPYRCIECARLANENIGLGGATWPIELPSHVCAQCGGAMTSELAPASLIALQKTSTAVSATVAKVIDAREELLSRAVTDAKVAEAVTSSIVPDAILGKYRVVRRLSEGGMAEVYLAKQIGIGGFEKPVALKRILRKFLETRKLAIELFLNEAKIAGRITHPNIVQVLDVGEVQGSLYLAMEYVHGRDLRAIQKKLDETRRTMALGDALFVVQSIALALDHAYWSTDIDGKRLAVVHRDISPHNVILGYDGAIKLADFGVAMSAVTDQVETMVVGKLHYMSPEAMTGESVDHRSDLFSLGIVLYLLCSGRMPFSGKDPQQLARKIRAGEFRPLSELVPVPDELDRLVNRLLASDPTQRPQRGRDVAAALTEIARHSGMTSSNATIAELLADLFPEPGAAPVVEQVNTFDLGSQIKRRPSSRSITPRVQTGVTPTPRSSSISIAPARTITRPAEPRTSLWFVAVVFAIVCGLAIGLYLYLNPK